MLAAFETAKTRIFSPLTMRLTAQRPSRNPLTFNNLRCPLRVWALIAAKDRGKTLSFAQAIQHTYTVVFQYKSLSTTRYESRFTVEGNTVQQEAYERLERLPNAKSNTARFRAVYNAPKAARTQHTGG